MGPLKKEDANDNIFLAGSISKAMDWQKNIQTIRSENGKTLRDEFNIVNPRRPVYEDSPEVELQQISWEFLAINDICKNILFWFSYETVAPITLFEYGKVLEGSFHNNVYVGIHPDYPRKRDVEIQTALCGDRRVKEIVYSLEDLVDLILD